MSKPTKGLLIVLSGPSGCGKTSIINLIKERRPGQIVDQVTCTTRRPRADEMHGVHYYFMNYQKFRYWRKKGYFLEFAKVHRRWYGTPLGEVLNKLNAGQTVIMDIDVRGTSQIRSCEHPVIREALLDIFIYPPDMGTLESRLRERGDTSEADMAIRLEIAKVEIGHGVDYAFRVTNRVLEDSADEILRIIDRRSMQLA